MDFFLVPKNIAELYFIFNFIFGGEGVKNGT